MLGAGVFAVQMTLAVVGVPGTLDRWLACSCATETVPRYVVVLGGGGIPSGSGLMRTYHAVASSGWGAGTVFIVALPADEDPERSSVGRMRDELVMRGVPVGAIRMEYRGRNTREQAVNIRRMLGPEAIAERLAIVTSPPHVRRSVLCFRKAGFQKVGGVPAYGTGAEADLGAGCALRYGFWDNLVSEVEFARELCALAYYRLKGWI